MSSALKRGRGVSSFLDKLEILITCEKLFYFLENRFLLGFWRGVGYFFAIVTAIGGLVASFSAEYVTHQIVGIMLMVAGIFSIFLIRIIGALDSIQYDLRYLANKEKKLAELVEKKDNEEKE